MRLLMGAINLGNATAFSVILVILVISLVLVMAGSIFASGLLVTVPQSYDVCVNHAGNMRLLDDSRRTLIENRFDDPRLYEMAVYSEVSWVNRRRLPIVPVQTIGLPPELVRIDQTANLIPEVGQSVATSHQQVIQRLAQQIVGTMEAPW